MTPFQAVFLYRSGPILKNSVRIKSPLPDGYYFGGNFSTSCTSLPNVDLALSFCEDVVFWDLFDTSGKLSERRAVLSCDSGRKQWNKARYYAAAN